MGWAGGSAARRRCAESWRSCKGGLADRSCGVEAQLFYLLPTNYHNAGGAEPTQVRSTHWAEAVKTWQISDATMLPRLQALTILDSATIETRYRFRPDQAINVIAVRAYRLASPADVVMKSDYSGCRSWVSINEEIEIDGSVAALSDRDLDAQIHAIEMLLAEPVPAWN